MRLIFKGIAFVFLLSGCAGQNNSLFPQDNVAEFATQPTNSTLIPPSVLKRAAYTTLRRGYSHFTIASYAGDMNGGGFRPSLDFRYGRNPYGFGDPGTDPGLDDEGWGVGAGIGVGINRSDARAHWQVVMYNLGDGAVSPPPNAKLYNARTLAH